MGIAYTLRPDSDYYRTVVDRYYRQRPPLGQVHIQFTLLGLSLVMVTMYPFLMSGSRPPGLWGMVAMEILACGGAVYLTKALLLKRLSRSLSSGVETTITLSMAWPFRTRISRAGSNGAFIRAPRAFPTAFF